MSDSIYNRAYYYQLKSFKLCVECKADAEPNRVRCREHNIRHQEQAKRRRDGKKRAGLCVDCPKRAELGHLHCSDCSQKIRLYNRAYKEKRKERYRGQNLCRSCPTRVEDFGHVLCAKCRVGERNRMSHLRDRRRIAGLCAYGDHTNDTPQYTACSTCREKNAALKRAITVERRKGMLDSVKSGV